MATPAQRTNTWILDQWYDQSVAGTTGGYTEIYEFFGWGHNQYSGGLGQNNTTNYSSPIQLPGTTWASVSQAGMRLRIGTKTDGTLWSWGYNVHGQLGQNESYPVRNAYSSPIQIGAGTDWSNEFEAIGQGQRHLGAIKTDGTLWTWGHNSNGQLGMNTVQPGNNGQSSPVQIAGTTWSAFAGGDASSIALKTDGTMWTWGEGTNGRLGQNNTTSYSSPRQVGTNTNWSKITGVGNLMAIDSSGALFTWGYNGNYGQLGHNNKTDYSSPKQVPGTWKHVSTANPGTVAGVKTDGTLWTWGNNQYGNLGQNNTQPYSSPKQIGSGTDWDHVTVRGYGGFAIKTNGDMWSWGRGTRGSSGLNANTQRSSPIQIPGSWKIVEGGYETGFALKTT